MREWLVVWAAAVPEEAAVLTIAATFGVLAIAFAVAALREWRQARQEEADADPEWLREGGMPRW